jgi:hypothetical protein
MANYQVHPAIGVPTPASAGPSYIDADPSLTAPHPTSSSEPKPHPFDPFSIFSGSLSPPNGPGPTQAASIGAFPQYAEEGLPCDPKVVTPFTSQCAQVPVGTEGAGAFASGEVSVSKPVGIAELMAKMTGDVAVKPEKGDSGNNGTPGWMGSVGVPVGGGATVEAQGSVSGVPTVDSPELKIFGTTKIPW